MIADARTLAEITQDALRVLYHELGLVNTIRFLNQFTLGFGNYTEERRTLLEEQTADEVLTDLRSYQAGRIPRTQDLQHPHSEQTTGS